MNELNAKIGERMKVLRKSAGLSQKAMGEVLGISAQQIQKYERGTDRLTVEKIYILCQKLHVPYGFFFEFSGRPAGVKTARSGKVWQAWRRLDFSAQTLCLKFSSIEDEDVRRKAQKILNILMS